MEQRGASGWLGGVESGGVERCAGELSTGALLGSDHASGAANARSADQAPDEDQPAGGERPARELVIER